MRLSFCCSSLAGALLFGMVLCVHASDQNFTSSSGRSVSTQQPIELAMSVWRINDDGKEIEETTSAIPGDTLRYKVAYSNVSEQKLNDIRASIPVPINTQLLLVNTYDHLSASLDGEKYSPWPLTRDVIQVGGQIREELIPLSEIRSVSWRIPELREQTTVFFYVDVNVVK